MRTVVQDVPARQRGTGCSRAKARGCDGHMSKPRAKRRRLDILSAHSRKWYSESQQRYEHTWLDGRL